MQPSDPQKPVMDISTPQRQASASPPRSGLPPSFPSAAPTASLPVREAPKTPEPKQARELSPPKTKDEKPLPESPQPQADTFQQPNHAPAVPVGVIVITGLAILSLSAVAVLIYLQSL